MRFYKHMVIRITCILLMAMFTCNAYSYVSKKCNGLAHSQNDTIPLLLNQGSIYNDSTLSFFFNKLYLLKKNLGPNISILHLGDSHIQMGYFAEAIRNTLSRVWGLAGFGTIFPYQIARYNTYYVQTKIISGNWTGSNYLKKEDEVKYGMMGFTARTTDPQASLEINVRNSAPEISRFNKVHLFFGDPSNNYSIQLKGTSSQIAEAGYIPASICEEDTSAQFKQAWRKQVYCFDVLQDKLLLSIQKKTPSSYGEFNLFGFLFEDTNRKGVIYNNCGVGGSQFSSLYNNASYSKEQIESLRPDLIIFSYGSNESYLKSFDSIRYQDMVVSFIHSLKKMLPDVAILLTTPPDTRFKDMYPRNTTTIQKILITAAEMENVACWDLREQMGGDGSLWRWLPPKLAAPDKLHFTKEGYTLQANLFMQAFLRSYNNTVPDEDRIPDIKMGNYLLEYTPEIKSFRIELPKKMKNK